MRTCGDCGREMVSKLRARQQGQVAHNGRGLCSVCYRRHQLAGTLDDWGRIQWRSADLLEEWAFLRSEGYTVKQAEERLGLAHQSLQRAIRRAELRSA